MTSAMADPTPEREKSAPAGKPIGAKAAAPGGPKPASAVTKPPAGAAPKPAAGGPGKKEGDFKVIRSAPAPQGGSSAPLLIGGAVIALVIGGYFVINRKPADDKAKPPVTATDGTTTEPEITGPETMPDGIWDIFMERQNFLVGEGRIAEALKEAEEKAKEYPTSRKLRAQIAELRARQSNPASSTETTESPEALISQAEAALTRGNAAEALAKLEECLGRDGLPDPVAGRAYYLRALTHLRANDLISAGSDVESAASMNYDAKQCDELREKIASSQPR